MLLLRIPKLHQWTTHTPGVERRPASGAEPAGRRDACLLLVPIRRLSGSALTRLIKSATGQGGDPLP